MNELPNAGHNQKCMKKFASYDSGIWLESTLGNSKNDDFKFGLDLLLDLENYSSF